MKTRFTATLQVAAFVAATLAATGLLVAAGLGEAPPPDGTATIAHHQSPPSTP